MNQNFLEWVVVCLLHKVTVRIYSRVSNIVLFAAKILEKTLSRKLDRRRKFLARRMIGNTLYWTSCSLGIVFTVGTIQCNFPRALKKGVEITHHNGVTQLNCDVILKNTYVDKQQKEVRENLFYLLLRNLLLKINVKKTVFFLNLFSIFSIRKSEE